MPDAPTSHSERKNIPLSRADISCRNGHDWRHVRAVRTRDEEVEIWTRHDQDAIVCWRCNLISVAMRAAPTLKQTPLDAIESAAEAGRAP